MLDDSFLDTNTNSPKSHGKSSIHREKRKKPIDWPVENRCFLINDKPKWFWDSGHLIARRFGGENSKKNLTTQTSWLNSEGRIDQQSISHFEDLANEFFYQELGLTLDEFVKDPENEQNWHIDYYANEADYPTSAVATYLIQSQEKTFIYKVNIIRDQPNEIARQIKIAYYFAANNTIIENGLNIDITLENNWEGFDLNYQNKTVTSEKYEEVNNSLDDDVDDDALKIYYVINNNRFHDNVETPIYQTLQSLYYRLKKDYRHLRFLHLEKNIIKVYQKIRSGTKEWMLDQGLKASQKPLDASAQEHLDDIKKVIEAYLKKLDAEE